jgi:secretion/DNA translocation related CpaE-like protein
MAHDRPLVIATDETLLDEILRVAAAVGCETQRAPDLLSAGDAWARAPLVLLDEQAIDSEVQVPSRSGVLLVTKGPPTTSTWQRAFDAGVQQVVPLPDGETVLVGALADVAEGPSVPGGCVIGVVGGRGGAGASVFAAAIGLVAGDGALLVDCDPLGGGIDLLLGAEFSDGIRWPGLHLDGDRISMPALDDALPEYRHRGRRLPFLSCDREGDGPTGKAIVSVVDAGRRAGKVVVCDLPRHLDAGIETVVDRADLIIVVVPAEVRACVAARRVVGRLRGNADRARLVVRGPAPGGLSPKDAATAVKIPLLTSMAPERQLDKALENGGFAPRPRGPLAAAAHTVLAAARAGHGTSEAAA